MSRPKLHLDADTSSKALCKALLALGHDVTRTPQAGLPLDSSDEEQLHWASQQGRVIFTYNIRDFIQNTVLFPNHSGVLLAKQGYPLAQLIARLDRALSETAAEDWLGQVRWLSDWKAPAAR